MLLSLSQYGSMELIEILKIAVQWVASDIHLKAGFPPTFRVKGKLVTIRDGRRLTSDEVDKFANEVMNRQQAANFQKNMDLDLSYSVAGLGRFRVNVFQQRGTRALVFRVIPFNVQSIQDLFLPQIIERLTMEPRGLILVTGTTGSGKSTTLASMISHINEKRACHVITVEDPIEYLITDKRSIINQREVGFDTTSFSRALRAAMRQDPDVILVGEMRDVETIETVLLAAETGHLVLSTLHTLDATETINRIVSVFPPYQHRQIRIQLAAIIKGIVSQRLVSRADGQGLVPAVEILVSNAHIRELIEDKERTKELRNVIAKSFDSYGMQTFNQSLMYLFRQGLVTYDEALRNSNNPDDFALRVSGIHGTSDTQWDGFEVEEAQDGGQGESSNLQIPVTDDRR